MSEYDYKSGFDLASVEQPTREQLMQAIQQLLPLINRGGIIFSDTSPDVAGNPHLKRYIWLDTSGGAVPVPKQYDIAESAGLNNAANWQSVSIAAGSITNTQIAVAAGILITKLGITGTGAGARALVRINAANTAMEFIAPASINTTNEIPVNNLVAHSGDGYLKTVGGSVVWVSQATERSAIQNAIAGLNPVQIAAGTNGYLLGASGGVTTFLSPDAAIGVGNLSLSRLSVVGAATNDLIRFNGASWEKVTPSLNLVAGSPINSGTVISVMGGAAVFTLAHGLGAAPKLVRVVCRCDTIDNGFAVGDELDISCLRDAGNPSAAVSYDGTNITVTLSSAAGNSIPNKGTGVFAAMTETSWTLKAYAWR